MKIFNISSQKKLFVAFFQSCWVIIQIKSLFEIHVLAQQPYDWSDSCLNSGLNVGQLLEKLRAADWAPAPPKQSPVRRHTCLKFVETLSSSQIFVMKEGEMTEALLVCDPRLLQTKRALAAKGWWETAETVPVSGKVTGWVGPGLRALQSAVLCQTEEDGHDYYSSSRLPSNHFQLCFLPAKWDYFMERPLVLSQALAHREGRVNPSGAGFIFLHAAQTRRCLFSL